jgi:hypothetical protein
MSNSVRKNMQRVPAGRFRRQAASIIFTWEEDSWVNSPEARPQSFCRVRATVASSQGEATLHSATCQPRRPAAIGHLPSLPVAVVGNGQDAWAPCGSSPPFQGTFGGSRPFRLTSGAATGHRRRGSVCLPGTGLTALQLSNPPAYAVSSPEASDPMTLGNMRANGVRSLDVSCWQCHHRRS